MEIHTPSRYMNLRMEIYKIENATMMDSIEIVCEVRQSKVVNEDEDVQVEKMEVSEN